jgi:hypothetical protein
VSPITLFAQNRGDVVTFNKGIKDTIRQVDLFRYAASAEVEPNGKFYWAFYLTKIGKMH